MTTLDLPRRPENHSPHRTPVRRRSLGRALAALSLAGVIGGALAACSEPEPEGPVGPAPIRATGETAKAPSGQVTAVIDVAGDSAGVVLRDAAGNDVWADDFPYRRSAPPQLVWQIGDGSVAAAREASTGADGGNSGGSKNGTEQDVLWVIAPEGVARIHRSAEGHWVKEAVSGKEQIPEQIRQWVDAPAASDGAAG